MCIRDKDCATDDTKEKLLSLIQDPRMRIIEIAKNLGLSESRDVYKRQS